MTTYSAPTYSAPAHVELCIQKYWDSNLGQMVYPEHWEPRINQYLYHSTTDCAQPFDIGPFVGAGVLILLIWGVISIFRGMARSAALPELQTPDDFDKAAKLLRARTDYLHEQIDNELKSADLQAARRIIEGHAKVVEPKK